MDGRHCRSRSNIIGTSNIVIEKASEDDREERKIVHRTVRKLRNELPDEVTSFTDFRNGNKVLEITFLRSNP